MAVAKSVQFTANQWTGVTVYPVGNTRFYTSVTAKRAVFPFTPVDRGTPISYVNPIIEPDPVEIDASDYGFATIYSCNWNRALVYVAHATMGCFEDLVQIGNDGLATIELQPCSQTATNSPPRPVPRRR